MRLRVLAAISTCLMLSCSAIASFDGLAGKGTDAGADAKASADGAASLDSSGGNGGADANANADANGSGDAATSGDGGNGLDGTVATGFCAKNPAHTFCDDFDDQPLAANWTSNITNGTADLDTFFSTSPPYNARAFAPAPTPDAGMSGLNAIEHKLPAAPTMTVEASFRMVGTTTSCDFVSLEFDTNQAAYPHCYLDLSFFGGNVNVEAECKTMSGNDYYQTAVVSAGKPGGARFTLSADLANAAVAGKGGGMSASVPLPAGLTVRTSYSAGAGVLYNGESGTCTVHVDDVLVDSK